MQWDHSILWLWSLQDPPFQRASTQRRRTLLQTAQGSRTHLETQSLPCKQRLTKAPQLFCLFHWSISVFLPLSIRMVIVKTMEIIYLCLLSFMMDLSELLDTSIALKCFTTVETSILTRTTAGSMVTPTYLVCMRYSGASINVYNNLYSAASEFANGECWGYKKYYELARLVSGKVSWKLNGPEPFWSISFYILGRWRIPEREYPHSEVQCACSNLLPKVQGSHRVITYMYLSLACVGSLRWPAPLPARGWSLQTSVGSVRLCSEVLSRFSASV